MTEGADHVIDDASRGDPAAIDALVERHLSTLRAFIRLRAGPLVRGREGHSDLVQSVCREVLENARGFQYRGEAAFKAWLCTMALRKLTEKQRFWTAEKRDVARNRTPAPEADTGPGVMDCYRTVASPSEVAMGREDAERLEQAFDGLPEDYRQVILLSRFVGLSHDEVAREMGRTVPAVKNLLLRAVARLGILLGAREGS